MTGKPINISLAMTGKSIIIIDIVIVTGIVVTVVITIVTVILVVVKLNCWLMCRPMQHRGGTQPSPRAPETTTALLKGSLALQVGSHFLLQYNPPPPPLLKTGGSVLVPLLQQKAFCKLGQYRPSTL